jgi:hypothetical protein
VGALFTSSTFKIILFLHIYVGQGRIERSESCTLGATSLLSMSVILLMLSDMMPKSADGFPLIGMID